MHCVPISRFFCFIICLNFVSSSSSIYEKKCNHSSECTVYPNITQGPDLIWIPYFCNENNLCSCPYGLTPSLEKDICIGKVSGWFGSPCANYMWAIISLVIILFVVTTYTCSFVYSKRYRHSQSMRNDQHSSSR